MTLVLSFICHGIGVQVADRLVCELNGRTLKALDAVANKLVIYRSRDAIVSIGYAGQAFIGELPTDEWIARFISGVAMDRKPEGMGGIRLGGITNNWDIGQAVRHLRDEIPQHVAPGLVLQLAVIGFQFDRRNFVRPLMYDLEFSAGHVTKFYQAPRVWRRGQGAIVSNGVEVGNDDLERILTHITARERSPDRGRIKGLLQFLDPEQQRLWMEGETNLPDAAERSESLELRFKYAARFEKLLRRPQAQEVLEILRIYAESCIPIPRTTERRYWSVSCLPSTSDKPLARVNASWMELFTLLPDGEGIRARFILHLSDFTTDGSPEPDHLDQSLLEQLVERPEACPERSRRDLSHFFWKGDTFGIKVHGAASIRAFLAHPHGLRAIRRFNLTHMNRGRNAYQASHCFSLADCMLED